MAFSFMERITMLDGAELFKLHAGLDTVEGEEMY
jgi:hypothetical protein